MLSQRLNLTGRTTGGVVVITRVFGRKMAWQKDKIHSIDSRVCSSLFFCRTIFLPYQFLFRNPNAGRENRQAGQFAEDRMVSGSSGGRRIVAVDRDSLGARVVASSESAIHNDPDRK
jgi:hypothetical protein